MRYRDTRFPPNIDNTVYYFWLIFMKGTNNFGGHPALLLITTLNHFHFKVSHPVRAHYMSQMNTKTALQKMEV